MRNLFVISSFILFAYSVSAKSINSIQFSGNYNSEKQFAATPIDSLNWKLLGMIKFIKKADKEYGEVMYPQVSPLLKQKAAKKIAISGL